MCLRLRYTFDGEYKVIQKMIKKSKQEEVLKVTFSRFLEQGKDLLKIVITNLQDTELDSEVFTLFCFCCKQLMLYHECILRRNRSWNE